MHNDAKNYWGQKSITTNTPASAGAATAFDLATGASAAAPSAGAGAINNHPAKNLLVKTGNNEEHPTKCKETNRMLRNSWCLNAQKQSKGYNTRYKNNYNNLLGKIVLCFNGQDVQQQSKGYNARCKKQLQQHPK